MGGARAQGTNRIGRTSQGQQWWQAFSIRRAKGTKGGTELPCTRPQLEPQIRHLCPAESHRKEFLPGTWPSCGRKHGKDSHPFSCPRDVGPAVGEGTEGTFIPLPVTSHGKEGESGTAGRITSAEGRSLSPVRGLALFLNTHTGVSCCPTLFAVILFWRWCCIRLRHCYGFGLCPIGVEGR